MNEIDKAYAAALLDGEGSIHTFQAQNQAPQMRVSFLMKDPEALLYVHEVFGGRYRETKTGYIDLTFSAADAQHTFLEAVEPYTKVKLPQVEAALTFLQTCRGQRPSLGHLDRRIRDMAASKIRTANRRHNAR